MAKAKQSEAHKQEMILNGNEEEEVFGFITQPSHKVQRGEADALEKT